VPRKASFKFENHWLHLSGFKEIVQNAWAKQHNGSVHNVLKIKLNETARVLKTWSKTLFRNARLRLQIANEVILRPDIVQESRLLSNDELTLRKDLKLRALGLAALDRARRKQDSRINWIKSGDACTQFFHLKMSAIRRKYIYSMKRQDGTLTWAHQEKEEIIHDFFSKLMGTKEARSRTFDWDKLSMSRLQELPGLELDRPFSEGKIEYAIKCLPNGKAPGPNGFTNDFYKSY
jgi:hypothetical protein